MVSAVNSLDIVNAVKIISKILAKSTPSIFAETTSITDKSVIAVPCVTLVVTAKITPINKLIPMVKVKKTLEKVRKKIFYIPLE